MKQYAERVKTKSDHQQEIRRKYGLRDFADAEAELTEWVAARAWTPGDGPKAIFLDAVTWLRERNVLLPGVTTLARLVARVRDDTTHRLWRVLSMSEVLCTHDLGLWACLQRSLDIPAVSTPVRYGQPLSVLLCAKGVDAAWPSDRRRSRSGVC